MYKQLKNYLKNCIDGMNLIPSNAPYHELYNYRKVAYENVLEKLKELRKEKCVKKNHAAKPCYSPSVNIMIEDLIANIKKDSKIATDRYTQFKCTGAIEALRELQSSLGYIPLTED
jgi:hypothetical protein